MAGHFSACRYPMRLTRLKLAGFKSFVDPTAVALPGQLVGVVGPNGCGKSNIMNVGAQGAHCGNVRFVIRIVDECAEIDPVLSGQMFQQVI